MYMYMYLPVLYMYSATTMTGLGPFVAARRCERLPSSAGRALRACGGERDVWIWGLGVRV